MTSDQTFRKIKKRARKEGVSQPKLLSRHGNRWYLIDKMERAEPLSQLTARMIQRGIYGDRIGLVGFVRDLIRWLFH